MNEKTPEQKMDEFKEAARPLIKYLSDNHHPHVSAIITGTSIELLESQMSVPRLYDYAVETFKKETPKD